ncbi:APH(3'') family aminoglycoside O-phosphotransferase [Microbacterium sp. NPDC091662]|uniref:APH(3'') family aminoglycoside O-phosphotransferase n=1 Tax=Microbacterium sp. NPDC091662 TaxID=3364211 RepID=UPI0037F5ABAD
MHTPAELLPDGADWVTVESGESGATVLRDEAGERYVKVVPSAQADELAAERDRITWLSGAGIPGPSVIEWRLTAHGAALVTSAVQGTPADQLDAGDLRAAWPAIADILRRLHAVPVSDCPYDRALDEMMTAARATVADGRVQTEFLPVALQDVPAARILAGLESELPHRVVQEQAEAVVCHGDFCLPNILIAPEGSRVAGLIDVGRLGRADPYADIALLLANARETWPDESAARRADEEFAARYGIALEPDRQDFYLRLDPLTW